MKCNAESNSRIAAVVTEIRDADCRRPLITDFLQTIGQQKFEGQPLGLGKLGQPTPAKCCTVAGLFGGYTALSPLPFSRTALPYQVWPFQQLRGAYFRSLKLDPFDAHQHPEHISRSTGAECLAFALVPPP
jgi:hypothetical protein